MNKCSPCGGRPVRGRRIRQTHTWHAAINGLYPTTIKLKVKNIYTHIYIYIYLFIHLFIYLFTYCSPKLWRHGNVSANLAPRRQSGFLVLVSGFPQPQSVVSIRQFAEHVVPVEYCDYRGGESQAHLRLKSEEDFKMLMDDLELTRRMLGCGRPEVSMNKT